jgi:hypothetical protein
MTSDNQENQEQKLEELFDLLEHMADKMTAIEQSTQILKRICEKKSKD